MDPMKHRPELTLMPFEPMGFGHVVLVGWQFSEEAEYAIHPHLHPDIFELHLVVRGQLSYQIEDHYHTMCGGDLLLIQPDTVHGTLEEPLGRCERYWLQIRLPQKGGSLLQLPDQASGEIVRQLRHAPSRPIRGEALVPLFERIRSAYGDEEDLLRAVNLRNLILRLILDFLALASPSAKSGGSMGIQKAIQCIEQSQAPVSLAELAKVAGMSESSFKLLFKKETGLPPVDYSTRHRIETARGLLHTTQMSITEVAHELGFSSSQHFATVFRRYTGLTPNEFRSRTAAALWNDEPMVGEGATLFPLIHLRQDG